MNQKRELELESESEASSPAKKMMTSGSPAKKRVTFALPLDSDSSDEEADDSSDDEVPYDDGERFEWDDAERIEWCDPCEGQVCAGNLHGERCCFGARAATYLGLQMGEEWTCRTCTIELVETPGGGQCSKARCSYYNEIGQCAQCRPSYAFN